MLKNIQIQYWKKLLFNIENLVLKKYWTSILKKVWIYSNCKGYNDWFPNTKHTGLDMLAKKLKKNVRIKRLYAFIKSFKSVIKL